MLNVANKAVIRLIKAVSFIIGLKGYGGTALPGYLIERFFTGSVRPLLTLLPKKVIVVVGTNGKTTTTKIISDVLRAQGLTVFTNASGSNFVRGILSQLINDLNWRLQPLKQEYAVLELDEGHGVDFVKYIKPDYVVALNILRDQLDRFGEIDLTAGLLEKIMKEAVTACVVNGNEPALVTIAKTLPSQVYYYGVDDSLRKLFPTDDEFLNINHNFTERQEQRSGVELKKIDNQHVEYDIAGVSYQADIKLHGVYNFQNCAAVLSLVVNILPDVPAEKWLRHIENVEPAFGRGEVMTLNGKQVELVLVKNPAGFQQALASYRDDAEIMIAINDNDADGKDVSWLWDVDFQLLYNTDNVRTISGSRAFDMALRLQYDNIDHGAVYEDVPTAVSQFLRAESQSQRIYCNYTAMLEVRSELATKTKLARLI